MAIPSPVGDVKIVSPISTFVLNTLELKQSAFFCMHVSTLVKLKYLWEKVWKCCMQNKRMGLYGNLTQISFNISSSTSRSFSVIAAFVHPWRILKTFLFVKWVTLHQLAGPTTLLQYNALIQLMKKIARIASFMWTHPLPTFFFFFPLGYTIPFLLLAIART